MPDIVMPEALYTEPNGKSQIVQVPGLPLRKGNVEYNPPHHKGHLTCLSCDAGVHFNAGSETIAGGNLKGPSPHFHTNPGARHGGDCLVSMRIHEGSETQYDRARGYRLHLDMTGYSETFNQASGLYTRDGRGRVRVSDPELAAREPYAVHTAQDIVKFMQRGEFARLKDTVIIHGRHVVPWDDFVVRYTVLGGSKRGRHQALVDKMKGLNGKPGKPCLMEIQLERGALRQERFGKAKAVVSRRLFGWRDEENKVHFIAPRIYRDTRDNTRVTDGFHSKGSYFVLGYPRLQTAEEGKNIIHFLTISVRHPDQFIHADIGAIHSEAVKRHDRRVAREAKEHAPA